MVCCFAGTVKVKSSNIQVGDLILVEKVSGLEASQGLGIGGSGPWLGPALAVFCASGGAAEKKLWGASKHLCLGKKNLYSPRQTQKDFPNIPVCWGAQKYKHSIRLIFCLLCFLGVGSEEKKTHLIKCLFCKTA